MNQGQNQTNKMNGTHKTYRSYKTYLSYCLLVLVVAILMPLLPQKTSAAVISKQPNNLGLVVYLSMNEGVGTVAHDFSGKNNNGSLSGTTTPTWVDGTHGKGLKFDGVSNHVVVPYNASMDVSGNAETVMAWVKHTGSSNGIFQSNGWSRRYFGSSWTLIDNSSNYYSLSAAGSDDGRWHQVVYTVSGKVITSYVDGQQMQQITMTDFMRSGNGDWWLGRVCGGSTCELYYTGQMDDFRLYTRALSGPEITNLYKSGQVVRKNVSNQGLVGYWPLNEGRGTLAHDFSGNGYNATLSAVSGGLPIWVAGKRNGALSFDGTRNYLQTGQSTPFNMGTGNFTLSAFITRSNTTGRVIYEKRGTSLLGYLLAIDYPAPGQAAIFLNDSISGQKVYSFSSANLNQLNTWYHVAVVVNRGANTATLYVNGSFKQTVDVSGTSGSIDGDGTLKIGYDLGGSPFSGLIDDARIYKRALSADEVSKLAQSGETTINANQNNRLTSGLVGYWTFNGKDMTTATATDVSGNGNDGSLMYNPKPVIGKVGQALQFNGSSSYVSVPNKSSLNPSTFTVSLWAKSNTATWNDYGFLFSKRDAYIIHPTSGSAGVSFYINNGTWTSVGCTPTGPITNWTMYTMSWDGTNLSCYINGALGSTGQPGGSISTSDTGELDIGRDDGLARYFNGSEDEVRFYNRALSPDEIKQLYNMGK